MRALALLVLMAGGIAHAGPLVHWQAPAGCPDQADVEQRIAKRLGPGVTAQIPVDVAVREDAGGFVAQIGDARSLRSASCSELADAAALVVARLVLEEPAPTPVAPTTSIAVVPPVPPTIAAPPPLAVVELRPAPVRHRELAIGVRVSALSGAGVQPGVSFGGELAVPIFWRELFVEPAGELWAHTTSSGLMPGVDAALRGAALRGGLRSTVLPVRAWLVAEVGQLSGEGINVMSARAATAAWAGIGAGGAFAWQLERGIAVVASAEAVAAIARPRFALTDGDLAYQPGAVAVRLAVGVEVAWP